MCFAVCRATPRTNLGQYGHRAHPQISTGDTRRCSRWSKLCLSVPTSLTQLSSWLPYHSAFGRFFWVSQLASQRTASAKLAAMQRNACRRCEWFLRQRKLHLHKSALSASHQFKQRAANGHCIVCSPFVPRKPHLCTFGAVGPMRDTIMSWTASTSRMRDVQLFSLMSGVL